MKILHTSDWHLGSILMSQSREDEHKKFLNWLIEIIKREKIDLLLIAGDIFDTATPPIYAQKLYFNFLYELSKSDCKECVILAGNHDSPHLLASSKEILSLLSIKVVEREGEAIEFDDFILLAVPYLREKTISSFISNQSYKESETKYIQAIKNHYLSLHKKYEKTNKKIFSSGHLSVTGAKKSDSERELYIGNLSTINSSFFEELFDYTFLGHFHKAQKIGKNIRYSGSVIPLSFKEAKFAKKVFITNSKDLSQKEIKIPIFKELLELRGTIEEIEENLKNIKEHIWCKIVIEDETKGESFIEKFYKIAKEKEAKILAVKYEKEQKNTSNADIKERIETLTPIDIFKRKLKEENITQKETIQNLLKIYEKIVNEAAIGEEE